MSKTDNETDESNEDEMLPDEREAVADRLDSLADDERLSVSDVEALLESDE